MLLLVLYCGFYIFGLLLARWITLPEHVGLSGITVTAAACIASLTLWLMTKPGYIDAWLAIAMVGAVAFPALMLGLGLLAGWWMRRSGRSALSMIVAAAIPAAAVLVPLFG